MRVEDTLTCDCFQHLDQAVRVGRASYQCPECHKDVSLEWFIYQQSLHAQ